MARRVTVLFLVIAFSLVSVLALAAADKWVVIKDKNGVCKVLKVKGKTPKTIAGPFDTEAQAKQAKEKMCPAAAKPAKKKADTKKAGRHQEESRHEEGCPQEGRQEEIAWCPGSMRNPLCVLLRHRPVSKRGAGFGRASAACRKGAGHAWP